MAKPEKNPEAYLINKLHKKNTEHHLKDRLYNLIIDRYSKNHNVFTFSDKVVWQGAIYTLPEIFGYILFFAIFYFIGNAIYMKYGEVRVFMFFMLLALWRLNILIKLTRKANKDGGIHG